MNFLLSSLLAGQLIPYGDCYLWQPELIGLHLSSDLLIALAYFSIPLGIIYFVRQRKDLPYPHIFLLFGGFIVACGLTHLMAVWTLWHPDYWIWGFLKAITAIISVLTAIIMVPLIPKALALPSPVELAAEIKERQQIEAELNASKKRFSGILEIANDAIISIDENQKIILFNQGAERIFGYQAKEVLGKSLDLLLPERFAAKHKEYIGEFVKDAKEISRKMNQRGKIWGLRKDGREFPAEASISQLTLGEEKILTVILNDISDRLDVEVQLKKALKQLTFHLDNSPLAVIEFDNDFRVRRWSQQAEKLFGWKPEEVMSKNATEWKFVFDEDLEAVAGVIESLRDGSQPRSTLTNRNYTKDGRIVYCEWYNSVLLDEKGNLVSIWSQVLDVSDRFQAEAALRESEHRYQTLTEVSPVGIFRADVAGNCLYVNDRWARMTGTPPEEAKGNGWTKSIFPADRGRTYREWQAAVESQQRFNTEYRMVRTDGEIIWVLTQAVPERGKNGEIIGYVGTITDISDRKQAEKLLAKQQKTLRAILNNAPIWIWMADTKGKMQFVNRTFCFDVGIPESRFLAASHYSELLGEAESANLRAADAAALAQNTPYRSEGVFAFADGELHELETITAKVKDNGGEAIALIGLAVDVTERKQALLALQRSEAKYREIARHEELLNSLANQIRNSLDLDTILETAVCEVRSLLQVERCYFVWYHFGTDKNEGGVSIRSEDSWEVVNEAKDVTLESFIGEYPLSQFGSWSEKCLRLEIVRVDDLSLMFDPEMRDCIISLGMQSFLSLPIETQSGKIGVLVCGHHTSVRPWLDTEVELLHAVSDRLAIAIDQAELYSQSREVAFQAKAQARELADALKRLQQAQTQLIQTEKMSSLGQLVAGIAHEINNPVNFIYGNVSYATEYGDSLLHLLELYQQHYPAPVSELQEKIEDIELDFLLEDFPKILKSIRVGADRIRQIVVSLRNFSRLDEAEVKAVNIHEGIESTLLILQNRLKSKPGGIPGIQLVKDYGELPKIECYAGQMNQVFMNVIANALDALEDKRRQLGSDGDVLPDSEELSEILPTLTIRTQVAGSNAIAIKIIDNGAGMSESVRGKIFDPFFTTKPVGSGTGLGLSISYQIVVEKHKGQLDCFSEVGAGTEFAITIPIKQPRS
jgi:PAS domain S-box-containing protein